MPCSCSGGRIDAANRNRHWTTFDAVKAAYLRGVAGTGPLFDGIGFCFDGEIGADGLCFTGIDFDNCIDGKVIAFKQSKQMKRLNTYTEFSPSVRGCHSICRSKPLTLKTAEVEIYSSRRYFTFTGQGVRAIRAADAELQAIAAELRAEQAKQKSSNGSGAASSDQPINTAEAFLKLDHNQRLAEGIEDHWFTQLQPAQQDEAVDYALRVIAAETPLLEMGADGGDNDQWYRLTTSIARSSAPHAEDIFVKYALQAANPDPEDALRRHFQRCQNDPLPQCREITVGTLLWLAAEHGADFEPWRNSAGLRERRARQIAENIAIGDDIPAESLLPQIMTLKEMHRRLVFIGSIGAVADLETKRIRKKEHAASEYAASQHSYIVKKSLKKVPALKLWIASKDRMTVEVLAWVPGAPQICQPPEERGPAFNLWRGLPPMAWPEDWQQRVQPFLEHVEYLAPVTKERERFLQWLAHIVQKPEVLPHTSYLMITPVTGVGRNLLASILVRALRGFVAAGISLPDLLDGGFTGRLSQKLLVIVDEAREGSGERRYQRAERLKSLITEEHRRVNHKYGFESIEKNCARWLEFSNYDDAIPFEPADRRVIVIANPTIRKAGSYYERLYGLLGDSAFIGSVRHWLETHDITGFRPGEHAPLNPAKQQALYEMMSETERAVAEFKEECKTELTCRSAIKHHVGRQIDGLVNDSHLTHAIRRAGMRNTARRIAAYKKNPTNALFGGDADKFTVVIVRGEWTPEIIKKADPAKLLETMGLTDWSALKPQG